MFGAQHRLSSTWAYVTTLLPLSSSSTAPAAAQHDPSYRPESSMPPTLQPKPQPQPQSQAEHEREREPDPDDESMQMDMDMDVGVDMDMGMNMDMDMDVYYSHDQPSPSPPIDSTASLTTGESDASGRSCAAPFLAVETPHVGSLGPLPSTSSPSSTPAPAHPTMFPPEKHQPVEDAHAQAHKVTFEDFALCYRQNQHKQAQRKRLERRLHASKVSLAVSARLVRIGAAVQRGLVESLKQDDKINFVNLYHTLHDLQDSCEAAATRRPFNRQDPSSLLLEDGLSDVDDSVVYRSPDFFLQLSPQSRADLLDFLHSVRTDPLFLFDRLRTLSGAQLTALVSSATALESGDSSSRSRTYPFASSSAASSFSKRISSLSHFQDHALAFERTDPLATLLLNVFAAPVDADTSEARLRVDVWSTVCAQLITHGGSRYYPLIGHILSTWALCSDWKAKPQFELYLMDILQTGAFLLEHIDAPPGVNVDTEPIDPLKTDVAEEFFASAVDNLFQLLDDPDAGLPHAVMEFGSAVLQRLGHADTRNRFLEYMFVHWFFSKFLYGALTYPEAHGLLLDFHIRKDAREKLLGQVGLQAYTQVFAVLRSMQHFMPRATVRQHVDNMLHRIKKVPNVKSPMVLENTPHSSVFHMLSATDVLSLLNALFPKTYSSVYHPSTQTPGVPASSSTSLSAHTDRSGLGAEPGFFRPPKVDHSTAKHLTNNKSIFSTDIEFLSLPGNSLSQTADRIRFELSELLEPDEHRGNLEHPSNEDWAIFSVSPNGKRLTWGLFSDGRLNSAPDLASDDNGMQSTAWGMEDNYEALQTAIVKLVKEGPARDSLSGDDYEGLLSSADALQISSRSLKQRFDRAMTHCHHESDFIGAHYWWNAGRQLVRTVNNNNNNNSRSQQLADDSWILHPMHSSCARSLQVARSVIGRCEGEFVALDRNMQRLQKTVKETMATVTKIRNKMWYMTDVKNSMRYEDARNVALALKTMIYSARLFKHAPPATGSRSRGARLGGSLLRKPELQVMDIIKAASSQGGPNKLSDEQVELTRKWLSQNNIDNFCRGEERIHRFCYEVKNSINRLVGETMSETPVLWASELFQRERTKFEGQAPRGFLGLSGTKPRPFGISEDPGYKSPPSVGSNPYPSASSSMFPQDLPALQSLFSDKWKPSKHSSAATDTSSIMGGSPGKTASTTTGDSCSTFWSSPHPQTHYAPSASSLYSRPPSVFSETVVQSPRRNERHKTHEKASFLDDLRQTLTSLLLSDLGSPVWSCGSETDAWFGNALDQKRIQTQMEKRARIQRFYDEYDERVNHLALQRRPTNGKRCRSFELLDFSRREVDVDGVDEKMVEARGDQPSFSYEMVFRRLMEVFSRHGNPFVKLKALRDLRALVIASLNTSHDDKLAENAGAKTAGPRRSRSSISAPRTSVHIDKDILQTPSASAESVVLGSRPSNYAAPTENQIVDALRDMLLDIKPKTVFRDLQFISAFVPGETLNKTDSGTAFVQFGLAALSLKDEVCNSMVEIADQIVSLELTRRQHRYQSSDGQHHHRCQRPGHAIEDAAGMWIITAKEGNPIAQRELAILYLTHPELLPRVTLPLTLPRDTFKVDMMYRRDEDSKSDPQSMCLALHWMQLSANGGDGLARNRLREREEFESIA